MYKEVQNAHESGPLAAAIASEAYPPYVLTLFFFTPLLRTNTSALDKNSTQQNFLSGYAKEVYHQIQKRKEELHRLQSQ
ncbi:MAG TPA: hypothetical protein V6C63_11470 [Allocoleopsis sp.]